MTCQPAVNIDFFLVVAFQAHSHPPGFAGQALQVLHLSMTLLAGNLAVDVTLMVEQDMFGHIIDFYPRRRRLGVEICVLFLNPGMLLNDIIMTVQALFHRRQSRKIGVGHIRVAVLALDLLDAAVHIVAERDRLFRADFCFRWCIEKKDKCTRKYQGEKHQSNGYRIFSQRPISLLKKYLKGSDQLFSLTKTISGNTFRKYLTAITIRPKNPSEIKPSEMLNGID